MTSGRVIHFVLVLLLCMAAAAPARAAGRLCLSTSTISFGNRLVDSQTPASATVSNCGNESWSFTSARVDPATGDAFRTSTDCAGGMTLAPGAHCSVDVVFAPAATGQTSGGLWFGTTRTAGESLFAFYGRGIDARAGTARLTFAPATAAFGSQLLDTVSGALPMELHNLGPGPLTPARIVLNGPAAHDFLRVYLTCAAGMPIAAGESCLIRLHFNPQAPGARLANLVIDAPELDALAILPISGVGVTKLPTPPANYQGLWWKAPAGSESGWGIGLAHQGDVIFATWFTYAADGTPWWLTMTADKTADGVYAGALVATHGPAFDAVPFSPAAVTRTVVGSGTITFTDGDNGVFAYTVNGGSGAKPITRQVFGSLPTCTWGGQQDPPLAANFQDMWWAAPAGVESGWGVELAHQGDTIFAIWFTYDVDGAPLWLSATAAKTAPGVYAGTLVRTTGPAYSAASFDPRNVTRTPVGAVTIDFADDNSATYAYTLTLAGPASAVTQAKRITRQVWAPPGTVCR